MQSIGAPLQFLAMNEEEEEEKVKKEEGKERKKEEDGKLRPPFTSILDPPLHVSTKLCTDMVEGLHNGCWQLQEAERHQWPVSSWNGAWRIHST